MNSNGINRVYWVNGGLPDQNQGLPVYKKTPVQDRGSGYIDSLIIN
jgi:hypothetical protein